jgi:hypothetical protein
VGHVSWFQLANRDASSVGIHRISCSFGMPPWLGYLQIFWNGLSDASFRWLASLDVRGGGIDRRFVLFWDPL